MNADELENRINELRTLEENLRNEIEELKEKVAAEKATNLIAFAMGKGGRDSQKKVNAPGGEVDKTLNIAISSKKKYESLKEEKNKKEREHAVVMAQICAAEKAIPIVEKAEEAGQLT